MAAENTFRITWLNAGIQLNANDKIGYLSKILRHSKPNILLFYAVTNVTILILLFSRYFVIGVLIIKIIFFYGYKLSGLIHAYLYLSLFNKGL